MDFLNIKTDNQIKQLSILASEIWHEYWVCILSKGQIDYMLKKFQSKEAIDDQIKNQNYACILKMIHV